VEQGKALELFDAWFVKPIKSMDVNGGFIAFMVALALYERLIVARLKLAEQSSDEESVKEKMAEDLKLDPQQRTIFWDMFRNGLLHQGMPKVGKTGYLFRSDFSDFPEFKEYDGKPVICIDPQKFAIRVLNEFTQSPELILASESFPLASVSEIELDKLLG
jgi:hypothetical protein